MSQQQKPSRVLELGSTRDLDDQLLSSVTLWSAEARDLRHWRTGLEFAGRRPTASAIAGISIDMIQPITHEYHDPHRDGTENLYGSPQMSPRDRSTLYSKRQGLFSCPLPFKKKALVRVKDVVGLILEQGRQYYKFNPAGSGCLYWHFELLEAFVERGWIERASLDTAHTRVSGLACRNVGTVPYPPVQGTFYRLDEVFHKDDTRRRARHSSSSSVIVPVSHTIKVTEPERREVLPVAEGIPSSRAVGGTPACDMPIAGGTTTPRLDGRDPRKSTHNVGQAATSKGVEVKSSRRMTL